MKNKYLKILILASLLILGAWLVIKTKDGRQISEKPQITGNQQTPEVKQIPESQVSSTVVSPVAMPPVNENAVNLVSKFSTTTVVVYGDTRTGHDAHRKVVTQILKVQPQDIFLVGDLVEDGNNPENWNTFNSITAPMKEIAPLYPAAGNHDKESALYYDNFSLPGNEKWYAVDIANAHFIVLNSNLDLSTSSEQYRWLENDLRTNQGKSKFRIVVMHHPLPEVLTGNESNLTRLFATYGVDLVFFGHVHNYQRFHQNNIYYVITGGGGAPLYDLTANKSEKAMKTYEFCELLVGKDAVNINVFDDNFQLIDSFAI